MAIYKSYDDLINKTLDLADRVIFNLQGNEYEYIVDMHCLYSASADSDTIIFEELNILNIDKYAKNFYNYLVLGNCDGEWPKYKCEDYEAATRLVLGLFKACEELNTPLLYNENNKFNDEGFSFTVKDIPKDCPYVIDQALVEFSKGIDDDYWADISINHSFVPTNYIPKYFKETSSEIVSDNISTIKSTSKPSLIIPCNYEEVTLSIKKKTVHF